MKPFLGKSTLERYQWNKIPQMSNLILLGQHNSEKAQPDTFSFSFFFSHFVSDLAYPPLPHLSSKGLCSRLEQRYVWKDVICVIVTSRITSRQNATSLLIYILEEAFTETILLHLTSCHCHFGLWPYSCLLLLSVVSVAGVEPELLLAKCKSILLLIYILIGTCTHIYNIWYKWWNNCSVVTCANTCIICIQTLPLPDEITSGYNQLPNRLHDLKQSLCFKAFRSLPSGTN